MAAPSGFTSLGVIGYAPKGNYDPLATYNKYETVYYRGSTYYCKLTNVTGITPEEGVYWGLMASGSAYNYQNFTVNNATADTSQPGYSYAQSFTWNGVLTTDTLQIELVSGTYTDFYAVEGSTDAIKIYLETQPSIDITFRVYRHGGTL